MIMDHARALAGQPSTHRAAVTIFSAAYMLNALNGARVAIRDSLAEAPFGIHSNRSIRTEFLAGTGTALSPGLPMLAAQGALTGAGATQRSLSATDALAIFGGLYFIGQLAEPITYRGVSRGRSRIERYSIIAGNLVLPAAMSVAAIRLHRLPISVAAGQ
jgi:hypothetical protein